jgi:serralysin
MIGTWKSNALAGATYDNDALFDNSIGRQAFTSNVSKTGNDLIDGVLSGFAWKGGKITYAFPDNKNDYNYGGEPNKGFGEVSIKIKAAAQFILDKDFGGKANDGFSVEGFTQLGVSKGSDSNATLRYAESNSANPTAYAYYPSSSDRGGDTWFGHSFDYSNAVQGNYSFATVIHETGHALGLKHGHEASGGYPGLPNANDSLEYSVMTYNSFVGDAANGYKNETWGYPQTYMMSDIAALQHMYGANFSVNSGNTVYSWKPNTGDTFVNGKAAIEPGGNRIFATIWDGGGSHDTYDLSAYSNNVAIDLRPGQHSVFKSSQLADLDAFSNNANHIASGNIYNALLYKGSTKSLIEDAVGGSGNDSLTGNAAANHLQGKVGNDRFYGFSGNDTYEGGGGNDLFFFKAGWDDDTVGDLSGGDKINLTSFNLGDINDVKALATDSGSNVVIDFGSGDTLMIKGVHVADLQSNDFVL